MKIWAVLEDLASAQTTLSVIRADLNFLIGLSSYMLRIKDKSLKSFGKTQSFILSSL